MRKAGGIFLDRKWSIFKMHSSLKGSENGQRAATRVLTASSDVGDKIIRWRVSNGREFHLAAL